LDLLLNAFNLNITGRWYLYIWSTFTLLEYLAFSYFLWCNIKSRNFKLFIIVTSILFLIFTTTYNIITNFQNIDSIPIGIEAIIIFIYSFYFLYEQMNDTSQLFIYNKFQFWIVLGILIYLAGSFFIFIFASRMTKKMLDYYWQVTNCFYALMNVMFIIGFYNKVRKNRDRIKKVTPFIY